ncbi:uncharacterized protein LOC135138665 [Zophobas morio]|uniref:uncharacterized protein LOC135138665 n=1 Tax=Zophobas morio TaxID=2755281 RepID=UPI003082DCA3
MALLDWTLNMDHSCATNVIYLDFARAFDEVSIKRLLLKFECFGVRWKLSQWIDAYLSNRYFCVGGSVLGPLLFLLYVGDLPSHLSTTIATFADDTKLYANPLTDYNQLGTWSLFLLDKNNPKLIYKIAGSKLSPVSHQRDFGVTISVDLKWEKHITSVVKTANNLIHLIKHYFWNPNPCTVSKLHPTYTQHYLDNTFGLTEFLICGMIYQRRQ